MASGRVFLPIVTTALMALLCGTSWAYDTDSPSKPSQAQPVDERPVELQEEVGIFAVVFVVMFGFVAATPPAYGWAFLGFSLIPILWGWRFMRASWAFCYALIFGLYASLITIGPLGIYVGLAISVIAGILGGLAGLYLQKACAAILCAIVCATIAAIPGSLLESDILMGVLAVPGFAIGLMLGWKAAYYMDAVESTLMGALVATVGGLVLVPDKQNIAHMVGVGLATFAVSCVLGLVVQFRAIRREKKEGSTPDVQFN